MNRKVLVLTVAALQFLLFGGLTVWTVRNWQQVGWIGLAYNPVFSDDVNKATEASPVDEGPRHIAVVVPRSPAARAGIAEDERIISVSGIEVEDVAQLRALDRSARTGDSITYQLESDRGIREVAVQLESPYASPLVVASMTSSLVIGLIWLAISLLVFWSRPRAHNANIFFLLAATGATMYFIWGLFELRWPEVRGVMPSLVSAGPWIFIGALTVLSVLFANLLLHLALIFPKTRPVVARWPKVFVWIHTAPFLLFAALAAMFATVRLARSVSGLLLIEIGVAAVLITVSIRLRRAVRNEGWKHAVLARPLAIELLIIALVPNLLLMIRLVPDSFATIVGLVIGASTVFYLLGFLTAYSVLTIVALYRSYRESGVDIQRQVRWPLWGTLTAVAASVVITVVSIGVTLFASSLGIPTYTLVTVLNSLTKAVYLLIPLSFAFAILKYRLLDIDIIIRKTVIYSGVTGIVLALYLILAGVSGVALVRTAGLEGETAAIFTTLAVVALFVPIRNRVQSFVDRRFFRRERSLESARRAISQMVLGEKPFDELSPAIADEVQRSLQCRSVALFMLAPDGADFRIAASVGLADEKASDLRLPRSSGMVRSGARVVRSVDDDVLRKVKAEMAAVAQRAGDPLGIVCVGSRLGGEAFDEDDEAFLGAVADQLSLAIGRSRQHRSDAELLQAREIQRSLLPAEVPDIEGVEVATRWQPAREVSGDYYDVLQLDDQRLALCIGDVVGKGMPAALLMSSLQASLKAVAYQTGSPKEVCTRVRDIMLGSFSGGTFVTFFYCVVERRAGRLSYSNAGHNPPLLLRSDGTMERLDTGGPIFARIAADRPYHEATVTVAAGDRLVLYTDGVTEATDADGEMFGESRLERILFENRALTAADLENGITAAVLAHTGGTLQDDLTMVVAAIGER
jgi:serine phosphatase RsbU (regulator of sigma subunit)